MRQQARNPHKTGAMRLLGFFGLLATGHASCSRSRLETKQVSPDCLGKRLLFRMRICTSGIAEIRILYRRFCRTAIRKTLVILCRATVEFRTVLNLIATNITRNLRIVRRLSKNRDLLYSKKSLAILICEAIRLLRGIRFLRFSLQRLLCRNSGFAEIIPFFSDAPDRLFVTRALIPVNPSDGGTLKSILGIFNFCNWRDF